MGHAEERLERVERLLLDVIAHQGLGTPLDPGPQAAARLEQLREIHRRDVAALSQAVLGQAPQTTGD